MSSATQAEKEMERWWWDATIRHARSLPRELPVPVMLYPSVANGPSVWAYTQTPGPSAADVLCAMSLSRLRHHRDR